MGLQGSSIWVRTFTSSAACGQNTIEGTEEDALEFARRVADYLRAKGVVTVEAWSDGNIDYQDERPHNILTFILKPHANGRDWIAEPNKLHHGGWFKRLDSAIDYALFRGCGKLCAIQVLNKTGQIERLILADQCGQDGVPCVGPSVGNRSSV